MPSVSVSFPFMHGGKMFKVEIVGPKGSATLYRRDFVDAEKAVTKYSALCGFTPKALGT